MTTMSYGEWAYQRACAEKRAYTSRETAKRAAYWSAVRRGQSHRAWGAYRCWFCGFIHVGHKSRRTRG